MIYSLIHCSFYSFSICFSEPLRCAGLSRADWEVAEKDPAPRRPAGGQERGHGDAHSTWQGRMKLVWAMMLGKGRWRGRAHLVLGKGSLEEVLIPGLKSLGGSPASTQQTNFLFHGFPRRPGKSIQTAPCSCVWMPWLYWCCDPWLPHSSTLLSKSYFLFQIQSGPSYRQASLIALVPMICYLWTPVPFIVSIAPFDPLKVRGPASLWVGLGPLSGAGLATELILGLGAQLGPQQCLWLGGLESTGKTWFIFREQDLLFLLLT